jgi:2-haloacid dehalogenase
MNRCSAPHAKLPIEVVVFGDDSPRNVPAAARGGLHALQFVDAHQLRHDVIALGIPSVPWRHSK